MTQKLHEKLPYVNEKFLGWEHAISLLVLEKGNCYPNCRCDYLPFGIYPSCFWLVQCTLHMGMAFHDMSTAPEEQGKPLQWSTNW